MNQVVRAWNRWQQRPKHSGPDGLVIDDETIIFPSEEDKMPECCIAVNEHSTVALALYGVQDRVENLFRETSRTLKRLKFKAEKTKPFPEPPEGVGSYPNIHDVTRWLDSLKRRGTKRDVEFLKRLHVTAAKRVRPDVLKQVTEALV